MWQDPDLGIFHNDLNIFYCCHFHWINTQALSSSDMVSGCQSIYRSACISTVHTGQISVKFEVVGGTSGGKIL
jgi:hypothetical protein